MKASRNKTRLMLGLAVLAVVFLTGCATKTCSCPEFPSAGPAVAEELEAIPLEGFEDFWGWIGELDKLKDKLDIANGN